MERLIDPDQLPDAARHGFAVQVRNRFALHQRPPALSLGEYREEIGAGFKACGFIRGQIIRVEQDNAPLCREQIPDRQIAGGGQHLSKEIVRIVLVDVLVEGIRLGPLQKLRLIRLVVAPELGNGLLAGYSFTDDGKILSDVFVHFLLQHCHIDAALIFNREKYAVAQGTADFGDGIRPEGADGQEQQEARRAGIHLLARAVGIAKQMDLSVGGGYCAAHGSAVLLLRRGADRNIIQGKHLSGNFSRQRPLLQTGRIHIQDLDQLSQGLSRTGLHSIAIDR